MKRKNYEISKIENNDKMNALIHFLNNTEQVTHIKISSNHLNFSCLDLEVIKQRLLDIEQDLLIEEIQGQTKSEYMYKPEMKKHYFMFKDVVNEDDIVTFSEKIESDKRYHDVSYDSSNKVLILSSKEKNPLASLEKILKEMNPSVTIYEYQRPIHTSQAFKDQYLKKYARIGLFLLVFALALVNQRNHTFETPIFYAICVIILSEHIIRDAFKRLLSKHIFHEDIIILIALALAVASGAYLEAMIGCVLYQCLDPLTALLIEHSFTKIDESAQMSALGRRKKDDQEEEVSLYAFDLGDLLLVSAGERIPLSGKILKGTGKISTYANTSNYVLKNVRSGSKVQSGDVCVKGNLEITVSDTYEDSTFNDIMQMASQAPLAQSKISLLISRLAYIYTPLIVIGGLVAGFILPFLDHDNASQYMHIGALVLMLSGSFASEQSSSMAMLSGLSTAFKNGILVNSTAGFDSLNACSTIIYDRFDNMEVTQEELDLFKKLSTMGRALIIFNDGPVALENDQYVIFNDLSVQEKLDKLKNIQGNVAYIGDSSKDISLLQEAYVGISRGGMIDGRVVENSDIVLVDADLSKVHKTFKIARTMRSRMIANLFVAIIMKVGMLAMILLLSATNMIVILILEMILIFATMNNATSFIE